MNMNIFTFKKKTIISIFILLCCLFISLLLSNVPYFINYFRNNMEGMVDFEKIDSNIKLVDLKKVVDDISLVVNEMDDIIEKYKLKTVDISNNNINTLLKPKINSIKLLINNIEVTEINSDLSGILTTYTPINTDDNKPEIYNNLVSNLKKEITSINKKIEEKKTQIASKEEDEKTEKNMGKSETQASETEKLNPKYNPSTV